MKNDINTVPHSAAILTNFISKPQLAVMVSNCKGEEGQFFIDKLAEMTETINTMPTTGETDGMGDAAPVTLHYFYGNFDWYITEKDMVADEPQYQAFGYACMSHSELGYISIDELIHNGVELDLHFEPCTLSEVKASR